MAPGDFECLLEQGFPSVSVGDLQWISGGRFAEELPFLVTAQSRREDAVPAREDAVIVSKLVMWGFGRDFSVFQP